MVMTQRRSAFPERLALVYGMVEPRRAYEMRYANELRIWNGGGEKVKWNHSLDGGEYVVKDGQDSTLLRYTTQFDVWEAVLLVTPYIRVIEGDGQFRGRLVFRVDGEVVVDGSVERYLVPNMESPTLDVPMVRPHGARLLYASYVNEHGDVPDQSLYGIMAPDKSLVELEIKEPVLSKGGSVKVEAGCIAALYTTKI